MTSCLLGIERYSLCRSGQSRTCEVGFLGPGSRTGTGMQQVCWACPEDPHLSKGKRSKSSSREELNCNAVITEASTDPIGSSGAGMTFQITLLESRGAGLTALCSNSGGLPPGEAALLGQWPFLEKDSTENGQQPTSTVPAAGGMSACLPGGLSEQHIPAPTTHRKQPAILSFYPAADVTN